MNKQIFINNLLEVSMDCMEIFHIPASFIIANAINESGWGKTELYTKYNNPFGLKYSAVKSNLPDIFHIKKVNYLACDGYDDYCHFDSINQAVWILCYYLTTRKYKSGQLVYKDALDVRYNVKDFCEKLGNIYAPNAKEVHGKSKGEMLNEIIEKLHLFDFDNDKFIFS